MPARIAPQNATGIIDRVVQQQRDAVFRPQPERLQRGCEPAGARLQLAIGQRAVGIDECDLAAEPARDIGVDEIGDGVVGSALREFVRHDRPPSRLSSRTIH